MGLDKGGDADGDHGSAERACKWFEMKGPARESGGRQEPPSKDKDHRIQIHWSMVSQELLKILVP